MNVFIVCSLEHFLMPSFKLSTTVVGVGWLFEMNSQVRFLSQVFELFRPSQSALRH